MSYFILTWIKLFNKLILNYSAAKSQKDKLRIELFNQMHQKMNKQKIEVDIDNKYQK